jgi:hypothetical protein
LIRLPSWLVVASIFLSAASLSPAQDQQLGARTKAMGGSYTAFEDDPVSIWLNPSGIATQPNAVAISYQTYTTYPIHSQKSGVNEPSTFSAPAETSFVDPPFVPSFVGLVFHVGAPDSGMAAGFCYARPYHLNYSFNRIDDPLQTEFSTTTPNSNLDQAFHRFRVSLAKDFRMSPPGDPGFLTHLSVGVAVDAGYVHRKFHSDIDSVDDGATSYGGGAGLLLGVYDNTESFRVNFGAAYQSPIKFNFPVEPNIVPGFDMPQQLNAGFTFYLFQGFPVRLTVDFQWVEWSKTADPASFEGQKEFRDALNYSFGAEYRIDLDRDVRLYPRLGFRRFDAPWSDASNLPMTANYKLVIDTKASSFNLVTFGLGLAWSSAESKLRSIDVGVDVGGDTYNLAFGVTYEF